MKEELNDNITKDKLDTAIGIMEDYNWYEGKGIDNPISYDEFRKAYELVNKAINILEILKKVIMITRNKKVGAYYGCYCLKLKPNIIPSEDEANEIKEWLDNA